MSNQSHDLNQVYEGGEEHTHTLVAIIVSKWNPTITNALFEGAKATLLEAGVLEENILRVNVPGAFELPMGAQVVLESNPDIDGVICLGCVIQGETRHFDFICQSCADGITRVSLDQGKPVIFGVLTPNTDQQAADRAGGKLGNKGQEAAVAFLEMVDVYNEFPPMMENGLMNGGFLGFPSEN